MMSTVDISKGWRKYSREDLIKFSDAGILTCGNYELSDFIEYLIDGIEEGIYQKAYDQGFEDGEDYSEIMGSGD
jgi:hypothetical protein